MILGFFGHHKCGSTWVLHVLSGLAVAADRRFLYSNGPHDFESATVTETLTQRECQYLFHVNANYGFLTRSAGIVTGVHVVRDPRDLLVSAYFSHRSSHPAADWPALLELREVLRDPEVSVGEGLLLEMEFCASVLEDLRSWRSAPADGSIMLVRFEDLVQDPLSGFRRMADALGLSAHVPAGTLEKLVDEYSFERLSNGRRVGEENPDHHYRKGVSGEWRSHFGPAQRWAFRQRYDDLLAQYGYSW